MTMDRVKQVKAISDVFAAASIIIAIHLVSIGVLEKDGNELFSMFEFFFLSFCIAEAFFLAIASSDSNNDTIESATMVIGVKLGILILSPVLSIMLLLGLKVILYAVKIMKDLIFSITTNFVMGLILMIIIVFVNFKIVRYVEKK